MNLDQIATKCFILALFIRDDGQRLLLGDGYYDFNQKLQHFQANTIANDIVEIQGDSGQLLAGQVMRSGTQKFEGYIGDATTSRQIIEQKRSDFMAFFRIKHFYKVIYIFPDGTAIQRQRGYLTDAPTIPEIFQKFPEYSIALNFEDANYYEYAEDEHGDEIYAHIIELALSGNATGGLIWDEIGAVSNGITWSGIQTAQGEYISITNELDIPAKLASVEMLGKANQDGTPTPDAPVSINTVTGEQTVKVTGKNILNLENGTTTGNRDSSILAIDFGSNNITLEALGTRGSQYASYLTGELDPTATYKISGKAVKLVSGTDGEPKLIVRVYYSDDGINFPASTYPLSQQSPVQGQEYSFSGSLTGHKYYRILFYNNSGATVTVGEKSAYYDLQLELGSTATTYEPYQRQEFEVNLGKNLFDKSTATQNYRLGSTGDPFADNDYYLSDYISVAQNTAYYISGTSGTPASSAICFYASDKSFISRRAFVSDWYTFTTPANTAFLRFTTLKTNSIDQVQLELGSQASSFAPYFTPIELAKIGTYQDRIYKDSGKWYIEKQVGKVVLDGSETAWNRSQSATTGLYGYWISTPSTYLPGWIAANEASKLCDRFTYKYQEWKTVTEPCLCENSGLNTNMCIFSGFSPSDMADTNVWKSWLSTHPTTVYYALATPTTTEITNEALIAQLDALGASSLYVGVNNIGTETQNAMPTLKIEYYTEYTLGGAGYEWEPGGNTAKTIVTVAGVDSAWPIWTVQGGAQNPTLTNITTGQTITWQGFVPAGQTLTINMAEMTADLAGANVFEYITGEWIRLAPGNNTLAYTAGSADKPSTLSWNGVLA